MDEFASPREAAESGVVKQLPGSRSEKKPLSRLFLAIGLTHGGRVLNPGAARRRMEALSIAVALLVSTVFSIFALGLRIGYAVAMDGETLGLVASFSQAKTVISNVEARAEEILGYDYDLDRLVTNRLTITDRNTVLDSKALERKLLDAIPEISKFYVVSIDGMPIGGLLNGATAINVIDTILNSYKTSDTVKVSFVQDLSIIKRDAPVNMIMEPVDLFRTVNDMVSGSELDIAVTERVSYTEAIPYETLCFDDNNLYCDRTKVTVEGVEGEVLRTTDVTYVNGEITGNVLVDSTIISNAVPEQVSIGTKDKPHYASTGIYVWPAAGEISSYFGYRCITIGSTYHKGIDIAAQYGSCVLASDGGEVIYSGYMGGYGYLIQILHDNGDISYYAHCSRLAACVGDKVAQGDVVAYVGNTGVSSGTHLHFEVRVNGCAVNPLTVLP